MSASSCCYALWEALHPFSKPHSPPHPGKPSLEPLQDPELQSKEDFAGPGSERSRYRQVKISLAQLKNPELNLPENGS